MWTYVLIKIQWGYKVVSINIVWTFPLSMWSRQMCSLRSAVCDWNSKVWSSQFEKYYQIEYFTNHFIYSQIIGNQLKTRIYFTAVFRWIKHWHWFKNGARYFFNYFIRCLVKHIKLNAGVFDVKYFCNWHCFCTSIHFAIIGNKSSHKLEVEVEKGFYIEL